MKMSEADKRKLESEQRAICRITNDDIVCKDCLLRFADNEILGNTSRCEEYPECKPLDIIFHGGKCDKYIKE